jgi:hypothetical protein
MRIKPEVIEEKDAADDDLVVFSLSKIGPLWSVWILGWTFSSCTYYDDETEARSLFKNLVYKEDWERLVRDDT